MISQRLSFKDWQKLAQEEPEIFVDLFLGKFDLLSHETREAFIAAKPDRSELLQKVKASGIDLKRPLSGVPYVLQDMFDLNGLPTRCGAPFQDPFEAPVDESSLLAQAIHARGAVCLAKTVPSEFGWDLSGQNPTFGNCPHGEGPDYVCGGGAGATAYAVANGWAPIGFGLDSCGGIRIPAAFHGLFGFRMEHNAYAREGVSPIVPSIESAGWMTGNLHDLRTSFLSFYYPNPSEPSRSPRGLMINFQMDLATVETRVGLMRLIRDLDVDDDLALNKMLSKALQPVCEAYKTIAKRELYSVHRYWIEEYRHLYDKKLIRQIEAGRAVAPSESDDASHMQRNLRATFLGLLSDFDYLILPVSPLPSPKNSDWDADLENEILQLNAVVSLALLPSIILPFKCGEKKYNAAQVLFNPQKMELVPQILDQVSDYYVSSLKDEDVSET
jgi:Asp-tRNA(Asn)/Glu-tRNA(Gln) amidotransferase A subunit family amidase